MTIKQLSVFLENKPGKLAGMMKALADAGVNIVTLSLANAPEFGIVRVIADDHVKGVEALTNAGFAARETEVVAVTVPRPADPAGLRRVLAFAHPRAGGPGLRIRAGYLAASGRALLAVRIPERGVTLPALNAAFAALWRAAGEIGGAA